MAANKNIIANNLGSEKPNIHIIILAGGKGTRYKKSQDELPKQFQIPYGKSKTMLEITYDRLAKVFDEQDIYVQINKEHKSLKLLDDQRFTNIITEPQSKNTGAAITMAICKLSKSLNDIFVFVPVDHYINDEFIYNYNIMAAIYYSMMDRFNYIFGIGTVLPEQPNLNLGYVAVKKRLDDLCYIRKFITNLNKQDLDNYSKPCSLLCNTGIYIFKTKSFFRNMIATNKKLYLFMFLNLFYKRYVSENMLTSIYDEIVPATIEDLLIKDAHKKLKYVIGNFQFNDLGVRS